MRAATRQMFVWVLVTSLIAGCSSDPARPKAAAPPAPAALRPSDSSATDYVYSLTSLPQCVVSDALTLLVNPNAEPAQITDVRAEVAAGDGVQESTYRVVAIPAGGSGELADSATLTALAGGHTIGTGTSAQLPPTTSSGKWYALVAQLHVTQNHSSRWAITGVTVTYLVAGKRYSTDFAQHVNLPGTTACGQA